MHGSTFPPLVVSNITVPPFTFFVFSLFLIVVLPLSPSTSQLFGEDEDDQGELDDAEKQGESGAYLKRLQP